LALFDKPVGLVESVLPGIMPRTPQLIRSLSFTKLGGSACQGPIEAALGARLMEATVPEAVCRRFESCRTALFLRPFANPYTYADRCLHGACSCEQAQEEGGGAW